MMRKYKVVWTNGNVSDNVWIHDGAFYTWSNVKEVLVDYKEAK